MVQIKTWHDVRMAAQFAKLYRIMAQARKLTGDIKMARAHEATAREYEATLRELGFESELMITRDKRLKTGVEMIPQA